MEESCSQLSQSQPSQLERGNAFWCSSNAIAAHETLCNGAGNGGIGQANGMFPVPQARKMLRKRYHSPPALRNVFLHGPEETGPVLPKAPLPASRYRYTAVWCCCKGLSVMYDIGHGLQSRVQGSQTAWYWQLQQSILGSA